MSLRRDSARETATLPDGRGAGVLELEQDAEAREIADGLASGRLAPAALGPLADTPQAA
jgi:hypothetical protein